MDVFDQLPLMTGSQGPRVSYGNHDGPSVPVLSCTPWWTKRTCVILYTMMDQACLCYPVHHDGPSVPVTSCTPWWTKRTCVILYTLQRKSLTWSLYVMFVSCPLDVNTPTNIAHCVTMPVFTYSLNQEYPALWRACRSDRWLVLCCACVWDCWSNSSVVSRRRLVFCAGIIMGTCDELSASPCN